TERRGRKVDVRLDLTGRCAVGPRLYDKTQDAQADWVSERAELLGVLFELRGHAVTSTYFEVCVKVRSSERPATPGSRHLDFGRVPFEPGRPAVPDGRVYLRTNIPMQLIGESFGSPMVPISWSQLSAARSRLQVSSVGCPPLIAPTS